MADREQQSTESTPRATQAEGRTETQTRSETQGRGETGRASATAQRSRRSEGAGGTQRSEGNGDAQRSSTFGEHTGGSSQTTSGTQTAAGQSYGGESSQEQSTEGRPRYGVFYASAMRRISSSPRAHGFGGQRGWEGQERSRQGELRASRSYRQSGFRQGGYEQGRDQQGGYGEGGYGQSSHEQGGYGERGGQSFGEQSWRGQGQHQQGSWRQGGESHGGYGQERPWPYGGSGSWQSGYGQQGSEGRFTQRGREGGYGRGFEAGRGGQGGAGEWQGGESRGLQQGGLGTSTGFTEGSFGQGGGLGNRGAYGSQYIRGTGGQTGEQLGYGRSGSELGTSGFDLQGGIGGYSGREWERGQGGSPGGAQQGRESFGERRLQDRDFGTGSRGEGGFRGQEFGRHEGGRERWREGRESGQWGGIGLEDPFETRERYGVETERRGRRTRWQREPITAGEIMTRDVKAVTKQSTLQNVAQIMKDENCGIVPIVDEDHKLLGVVTDRDLVIRTLAGDRSPLEVKVEDVMTSDVHAVTPDEDLPSVIELMGSKQVRRIAVVDQDDRLVGIISMGDIANRADYDEDLQDALESISSKRSFWSRLWS